MSNIPNMPLSVMATRRGRLVSLFADEVRDGECYTAVTPVMKPVNTWEQNSESLLVISDDEAVKLMDSLWDCGIRPTRGQVPGNVVGAIKDHLADMRQMLFAEHGVTKPEDTDGKS